MKKAAAALFLTCSILMYADDSEDFKYVYKLYQNKDMTKEVISELENFLRKYPNSKLLEAAEQLLGVNYYENGDFAKAKEIFNILKETSFKNESFYYLELIAIKEVKLEEAEGYRNKIEPKNNLSVKATYGIADAYFNANNFDKAEGYFKQLLKETGEYYLDSMLKLGLLYYKKDEYVKAAAILEAYISESGDRNVKKMPLVFYFAGLCSEKIGDYPEALKYYGEIIEKYKGSDYYLDAVYNTAKHFISIGEVDKAQGYAEKLAGTEYESDILIMVAESAYSKGMYDKASEIYERVSANSKDEKVLHKLVSSFVKSGKYDLALKFLPGLKGTAYDDEYYYYTFSIFYKEKQYEEIEKYSLEFTEEKESASAYKRDIILIIGESEYLLKKYDKAAVYYAKLYKDDKVDRETRLKSIYRIVIAYSELKNYKGLKEYFGLYKNEFEDDLFYKKDIYIMMAQENINKNELAEAESVYKDYLKYSVDETVLRNLVALLFKKDRYGEAQEYLKKLPDNADNIYLLGIAYLGEHDYQRAEQSFAKVLKLDKNKYIEEAYLYASESAYSKGDYDTAVNYSDDYIKGGYKKYFTKISARKAMSFFKQKKYDEAVSVYEQLKSNNELKDYAYFMLGDIYYNMKKYTMAIENYDYVAVNYRDSQYRKNSLYWLVNILYEEKKYDQCLVYIKTLLEDYKENEFTEDVIYYMANSYFAKNEPEKAVVEYEKLIKMTNKAELRENVINRVVSMYYKKGSYNEAMSWVMQFPESSKKTLWQGIILEKQGKGAEASAKYESIAADKENGDKATYYLGNIYMSNKQYEKARNFFSKTIEFKESEYKDDAVYNIGATYEEEGNYQKAIVTYMRIKLIYESSGLQDVTTIKIAENYDKLGETENSFRYYKEFYDKYKDSEYFANVVERIMIYYLNKKDAKTAEKYFDELEKSNKERADQYRKYFSTGGEKK